jgi:hypothetical protein
MKGNTVSDGITISETKGTPSKGNTTSDGEQKETPSVMVNKGKHYQ